MAVVDWMSPIVKTLSALTLAWLLMPASPILGDVPFPDVDESVIDPEIRALVVERIAKTSGETQDLNRTNEIDQTIVAKGRNAVATLIAMAQKAANTDPLVLGKSQDFGNELRCPVDMLVKIGDRRAIPLLSALMKFDTKPRRMFTSLARLLCYGTDKQIELDAKSQDPNLARVAQTILRYPDQYKYYRDLYRKK